MSRPPRMFVPQPLEAGSRLLLSPSQSRQLISVLRRRAGATVVLFPGDGFDYPSVVDHVESGQVSVVVGDPVPGILPPLPRIWLAQSLIKNDRFDWVVQKATELGVDRITPIVSGRTVVGFKTDQAAGRAERWRRIAIEASEQCQRATVPHLDEPVRLADLLAGQRPKTIVLWEEEPGHDLFSAVVGVSDHLLIVVGPEGGFSADEIERVRASNAVTASLGRLILRSETAAIAAVAALRLGAAHQVHADR